MTTLLILLWIVAALWLALRIYIRAMQGANRDIERRADAARRIG